MSFRCASFEKAPIFFTLYAHVYSFIYHMSYMHVKGNTERQDVVMNAWLTRDIFCPSPFYSERGLERNFTVPECVLSGFHISL